MASLNPGERNITIVNVFQFCNIVYKMLISWTHVTDIREDTGH